MVTTMIFARVALILEALLGVASAIPTGTTTRLNNAAIEGDDFYKPPPGYESAAPGTILKHRPVPNPITIFDNKTPVNLKAAWQLLYKTRDSIGNHEATVVSILVPHNPKPGNLFGFTFFSDSAFNACNPSVTLQVGTRQDNAVGQLQMSTPISALNRGYYVSIADDNGPQAAYCAGLQGGYSTLDSVRAAKLSTNITGLSPDPIVTFYGYSGGSIPVAFATELQPSYAPDVKIAGVALGGLIPNQDAIWGTQSKHSVLWSMFTPPTLLGFAHDYPNLTYWLHENLKPELKAEFLATEQLCFSGNEDKFSNTDMGKYFKNGWRSIVEHPVPRSVFKWAGTMGLRGTPTVPWYLFETVGDDSSPIELTDRLVDQYCKNGANIYYERNPENITHANECIVGTPGSFVWLADRHEGKPTEVGCRTVGRSDETIRAYSDGTFFWGTLMPFMTLLGGQVGPKSFAGK